MASYALNVPPSVPLKYTLLFGTGALIMRGAGCTINDLWDRNLDNAVGTSFQPSVRHARPTRALFHSLSKLPFPCPSSFFFILSVRVPCPDGRLPLPVLERTKTRPLARGDITPRQAITFLAPQLTAGLAVLTQLNWYRCVPA